MSLVETIWIRTTHIARKLCQISTIDAIVCLHFLASDIRLHILSCNLHEQLHVYQCGCIYCPPALGRCETGPNHFTTNILTFLSQNKQWWLMFGFLRKSNQDVREGYRTGTRCRQKRFLGYRVAICVVIAKISCVSYFVSYVNIRLHWTFVTLGTELKIFPLIYAISMFYTFIGHEDP